jgi:hypothetical protein
MGVSYRGLTGAAGQNVQPTFDEISRQVAGELREIRTH